MRAFLTKILSTPRNTIPVSKLAENRDEVFEIGTKIQKKVTRLFAGSLAIRQVDAGSDNACELELNALSNQYYDVERFGIHFVASPRHADMLMVTGPVTRNMAEALRRAYDATPEPKIVVAVGDDAIDGGLFKGSYAVLDGVSAVIPVHYKIPGRPPAPRTILLALLQILDEVETERSGQSR